MKKIFLVAGFILVVINSFTSLVFEGYEMHSMLFANFSLVTTTVLYYLVYTLSISDGFKIGYSLIFGISGLAKFICAVFSFSTIENNLFLLLFIAIVLVECLLLYISHIMSNKKSI